MSKAKELQEALLNDDIDIVISANGGDSATNILEYMDFNKLKQNIDKEKIKNLDKKKLKEASQGLEAEFLKVFLKQSKKLMFDNQNKENKAPGKDIMTDFMFERLAEHMAMSSPLGLSDMIVKDIEKKSVQADVSNNQQEQTEI